jgi:peptidoglycan/LPS O-acetylase OafA/YrhL
MLGQTPQSSVRFEALDVLRGICALLVVILGTHRAAPREVLHTE